MPTYSSKYLNAFYKTMRETHDELAMDRLWGSVENPIVEDIPEQEDQKRVTLLYRLSADELDGKTSIYLLSGVAGYDLTAQSKFSIIPQTDISYISLVLPSQLRCAYKV
jgi:hypothetical protein